MHATAAIGRVDDVPPLTQPTYRGVSRRRPKPSELAIDDAYRSGDTDRVLTAVIVHCERLYLGAPYLERGDLNNHLASIVSWSVLRSLPGYEGPDALTPPNGSVPLSSYVNMLAKSRHLDECRKLATRRQHEILTRSLAAAYPDVDVDEDLITHISDERQGRECRDPERDHIVAEFMETLTGWERTHLGTERVLEKAREWTKVTQRRRITRCKCHACVKHPVTLSVTARMLERHGGILTTYAIARHQ